MGLLSAITTPSVSQRFGLCDSKSHLAGVILITAIAPQKHYQSIIQGIGQKPLSRISFKL